MAEKPDLKRVKVKIRGRVQGVCFRMETFQQARRLGVKGWVRNSADGSVEGLFEGDRDAVDALVAWCERGPTLARVQDVRIEIEEPRGDLEGFAIR